MIPSLLFPVILEKFFKLAILHKASERLLLGLLKSWSTDLSSSGLLGSRFFQRFISKLFKLTLRDNSIKSKTNTPNIPKISCTVPSTIFYEGILQVFLSWQKIGPFSRFPWFFRSVRISSLPQTNYCNKLIIYSRYTEFFNRYFRFYFDVL